MLKCSVLLIFIAFICIPLAFTDEWHKCKDETFCKNLRKRTSSTRYSILPDTINTQKGGIVTAQVKEETNQQLFDFTVTCFSNGIFRIELREKGSKRDRVPSTVLNKVAVCKTNAQVFGGSITFNENNVKAKIATENLQIEVEALETNQVIKVNPDRKLVFGNDGMALSFTINNAKYAYGIPAHGDHLKLTDTIKNDKDPYRLFNLDYGAYDVESQKALYGSVPVLYAHSSQQTSGIFWDNPAQTFVDITYEESGVNADFISEAGSINAYILTGGKNFKDPVLQYVSLTGTANLPPLFSLGYHQSKWSYMNQKELEEVVEKLDEFDFPTDVMWLDIDYTDSKKYFTWDYNAFPKPLDMQKKLKSQGRKLVTIIDPHIKVEKGYKVYDEMIDGKYYVKNPEGEEKEVFEGDCWPGLSSYVDFFNPQARKWWGDLYQFKNYPDSSEIVHIWNDMNEPSVFEVTEKTMGPDVLHDGGLKHKEVHNMYGFMQTLGTYDGLKRRSDSHLRPFVLTRSHYAGTQRVSAIWTGDNVASWEHLRVSVSMCLSEALAGISFCGADVGGFTNVPTKELHQRWFQLGAWYPFFREHSDNNQQNREPFRQPKDVQTRMRRAIKQRYSHLPYWYTLWYEHENINHEPVIRPLFYEFPNENLENVERSFLVGKNILVAPVLDETATEIDIVLPGKTAWYIHSDVNNVNKVEVKYESFKLPVDMDLVPVFYKAGSIIPRRDISRRSSAFMRQDPYTLYIYLDESSMAEGNLYVDDTESFNYRKGQFYYMHFTYKNNIFKWEYIGDNVCDEIVVIERVYLYSTQQNQSRNLIKGLLASANYSKEIHNITYLNNAMIVNNLGINATDFKHGFQIQFV